MLELLRRVGIADPRRRFDAFAQELSGGMAQRALIAMALAAAPRLLVADEPTSGLDVTVQAQFLDFMWRSARDRGTGMLLITQEPGILANYCDRVVVMAEGSLRSDQPTAAYFASWPVANTGRAPIAKQAQSPLLETTGLSRLFPIERGRRFVHAVSDVDLALQPGETLGIVGESGSGKTTVGRCLMGLPRTVRRPGSLAGRSAAQRNGAGGAPPAARPSVGATGSVRQSQSALVDRAESA